MKKVLAVFISILALTSACFAQSNIAASASWKVQLASAETTLAKSNPPASDADRADAASAQCVLHCLLADTWADAQPWYNSAKSTGGALGYTLPVRVWDVCYYAALTHGRLTTDGTTPSLITDWDSERTAWLNAINTWAADQAAMRLRIQYAQERFDAEDYATTVTAAGDSVLADDPDFFIISLRLIARAKIRLKTADASSYAYAYYCSLSYAQTQDGIDVVCEALRAASGDSTAEVAFTNAQTASGTNPLANIALPPALATAKLPTRTDFKTRSMFLAGNPVGAYTTAKQYYTDSCGTGPVASAETAIAMLIRNTDRSLVRSQQYLDNMAHGLPVNVLVPELPQ